MSVYDLENDLFGFQWQRDSRGYSLRQEPVSAGEILFGEGLPFIERKGGEPQFYSPRSEPKLARIFAKTEPTPTGAHRFVSQYGYLESPEGPESVVSILKNVDRTKSAIEMIDWHTRLSRSSEIELDKLKDSKNLNDGEKKQPKVIKGMSAILLNIFKKPSLKAELKIFESAEDLKIGLSLQPITLLDSMWLQIAEELTNGAKFRYCIECKDIMEIGHGKSRSDKEFCSSKCYMRWVRKGRPEITPPNSENIIQDMKIVTKPTSPKGSKK